MRTVVAGIRPVLRLAKLEGDAAFAYALYLRRQTPVTQAVAADFVGRDLRGTRIVCSIHLDIKMIPVIEALAAAGAETLILTCNAESSPRPPNWIAGIPAANVTSPGRLGRAVAHGSEY
jgi:S-adenosylhomocysteine hydrolase